MFSFTPPCLKHIILPAFLQPEIRVRNYRVKHAIMTKAILAQIERFKRYEAQPCSPLDQRKQGIRGAVVNKAAGALETKLDFFIASLIFSSRLRG
jgi:hypothetical protein